jgi:hypothetical protein
MKYDVQMSSGAMIFIPSLMKIESKLYRSWLRNYATSWKVASTIPDDIIGFLNFN